jgi:hypothetical protein
VVVGQSLDPAEVNHPANISPTIPEVHLPATFRLRRGDGGGEVAEEEAGTANAARSALEDSRLPLQSQAKPGIGRSRRGWESRWTKTAVSPTRQG